MANKIQVKRGTKANLPTLDTGELGFCTDTNELYIGGNSTNQYINGVGSTSGLVVKTGTNGILTTGTVATANIADSAVTSAKIADGTIVAGDLASNAVTTVKITDANVTTAKLAANAVNNAKMATMAAYTLKGNNTNAADAPQDISASNVRSMISAADVTAFSAHYTNGIVDGLGLGTPATGSGNVDVADTLNSSLRNAIGAAGNRNLLDNWDFRNPVNQRAVTAGTVDWSTYFLDRWLGLCTYTINAGSLSLAAGSYIVQKYEIAPIFPCTLSVLLANGTIFASKFTETGAKPISGYGVFDVEDTFIAINNINSVEIKAVKLELGTVSTLANDPPADYGEELLKCRRYFEVWQCGHYRPALSGCIGSATSAYFILPYKVTKCANPTIADAGIGSYQIVGAGSFADIEYNAADTQATKEQCYIAFKPTTGSLIGTNNAAVLIGINYPKIYISAEL